MKTEYDFSKLCSKDRNNLGMFISLGAAFDKTKIHKCLGFAAQKKGFLIDEGIRWKVALPWQEAYKKYTDSLEAEKIKN